MQETNLNSETSSRISRKLVFIYTATAFVLLTAGLITGYVVGANRGQLVTNDSKNNNNSAKNESQKPFTLSQNSVTSSNLSTLKTYDGLTIGVSWNCTSVNEDENRAQMDICHQLYQDDIANTKIEISNIVERADESGVTEGDVVILGNATKSQNNQTPENKLFIYEYNVTGSAYIAYFSNGQPPACRLIRRTDWNNIFSSCVEEDGSISKFAK